MGQFLSIVADSSRRGEEADYPNAPTGSPRYLGGYNSDQLVAINVGRIES